MQLASVDAGSSTCRAVAELPGAAGATIVLTPTLNEQQLSMQFPKSALGCVMWCGVVWCGV